MITFEDIKMNNVHCKEINDITLIKPDMYYIFSKIDLVHYFNINNHSKGVCLYEFGSFDRAYQFFRTICMMGTMSAIGELKALSSGKELLVFINEKIL